jgi:hypothetical protein
MKVQAVRREGGFFIPITEELRRIKRNRILLEINILEPGEDAWPDFFSRAKSVFGEPSGKSASACVLENREDRF